MAIFQPFSIVFECNLFTNVEYFRKKGHETLCIDICHYYHLLVWHL